MLVLTIEKLVNGGQGLARIPDTADPKKRGKVAFVWNALAGETVEAEIISNKKDFIEAVATKIITPSPERIEPKETSFLSTSPWQILDPERETYWKKAMAIEAFGKIGGLILHGDEPALVDDTTAHYGYRNKMEFSFTQTKDGEISLAFYERGKKEKDPVLESLLATPEINKTAKKILDWIQEQHIPLRSLKSLIIRSSRFQANTGKKKPETIAALFIKDKLPFNSYPELDEICAGFQLYYSTHKSPASVPTALLYTAGQDYLIEQILGAKLMFGLNSFFQINPPIFEEVVKDMAAFLDPQAPLLDLYSGVGAIGLAVSQNNRPCTLVESNEEGASFAKKNIELNKLTNAQIICVPAEKVTEQINNGTMVIVDPPRAGLHTSVINAFIQKRPTRIVYLSCNVSTQARDVRLLSEQYKVAFIKFYNFFPRTPHIESLCVLELI